MSRAVCAINSAAGWPASITETAPPLAATVTPTPSLQDWLYPYTLDGLRDRKYGTGQLEGIEEIDRTSLFTRFAITYSSDGLLITGTMQIPIEGKPPFPVIIMNHDYFNRAEYKSGDGTDRAAEYLNRHGYLTLSSDYRSWGGSEIGPSLYYSGLVIDVLNLMTVLKSIPEADPGRMGMWGHSMG